MQTLKQKTKKFWTINTTLTNNRLNFMRLAACGDCFAALAIMQHNNNARSDQTTYSVKPVRELNNKTPVLYFIAARGGIFGIY